MYMRMCPDLTAAHNGSYPKAETEAGGHHRERTPPHEVPCVQKTPKPILAGLRCSVRLGFAPFPNCRAFDVRSYFLLPFREPGAR